MRFEIKIHSRIEHPDPVLIVLFYTGKEEDYLNGCEDGIYNCACTLSSDTRQITSIIENAVNRCIETYEHDLTRRAYK